MAKFTVIQYEKSQELLMDGREIISAPYPGIDIYGFLRYMSKYYPEATINEVTHVSGRSLNGGEPAPKERNP